MSGRLMIAVPIHPRENDRYTKRGEEEPTPFSLTGLAVTQKLVLQKCLASMLASWQNKNLAAVFSRKFKGTIPRT
jgi:hypothetical protein